MRWSIPTADKYLRSKLGCTTVQSYNDAGRAVARLTQIWEDGCTRIRNAATDLKAGTRHEEVESSGRYPFLAVAVPTAPDLGDVAVPYGVCQQPGLYYATLSQLPTMADYWFEQISLLIKYHGQVMVGISDMEIPLKYVPGSADLELPKSVQQHFHGVNPIEIGDSNTFSDIRPLAHFSASQTDYWMSMGRHHMGSTEKPGSFVVLANYPFYMEMFAEFAQSEEAKKRGYTEFIPATMSQVGTATIPPQMPMYLLKHKSGHHVSAIQIGVGASNAITIAKELAIYRPFGVILAGHTGSMRRELRSGHYVIGESFFRDTAFYDDEVPMDVPIPYTREFSTEIRQAVMDILGVDKAGMRKILHSGTIASTMRRDWELERKVRDRLVKARPVSVEMEAAYLMAGLFDMAISAGVLLCASDAPLFGDVKEHTASRQMYGTKTMEHLQITMAAIDGLRNRIVTAKDGYPSFISRRLRGFDVPPLR